MIYTHTETSNPHVIQLNLNLGYHEVRRGPLWDATERVSLVKWLDDEPAGAPAEREQEGF
jgi:hypothetical protein